MDIVGLGDNEYMDAMNDAESADGVSRVEELENILSQIIDFYDRDLITVAKFSSADEVEEILGVFEKAYTILAEGEL